MRRGERRQESAVGPVLFVSSAYGTPRHRCQIPRQALARLSVDADFVDAAAPGLLERCTEYSHLIFNRVPYTHDIALVISRASAGGATILFDVDDLIFDPDVLQELPFVRDYPPDRRARLLEASRQIRDCMRACGRGLCTTRNLAKEVRAVCSASVVENCVSDDLVELSSTAAASREPERDACLGFLSGHPGHVWNFAVVRKPLTALFARHRWLRLRVVGFSEGITQGLERFVDRIDLVPYVDWHALPTEFTRMDVCLAPLADHRFNASKSDLRYLEASLCAVPLVASRVGQFGDTIRDQENGFLATDEDEWLEKLEGLVTVPELRATVGAAARDEVLRHRRLDAMGQALLDALAGT